MRELFQWQLDHYGETVDEAEYMWDPDSVRWVKCHRMWDPDSVRWVKRHRISDLQDGRLVSQ
jgi:hypothetical protein